MKIKMLCISYCYTFDCNWLESSNARSERLTTVYSDPMTEVYLMFYQAVLQVYVKFNMFLQREDPLIPVLHNEVNSFLKKLFSSLLKWMQYRLLRKILLA